ncbi:hypothetical protein A3726_14755 [Erythrobacter sp. HI0037]|nr:hypothetical protein A3719_07520 [Erythrobacter sp. HI0020]KZY12382.1 hypothetical protein A3726_14755 [Erythrobacter sp. HI0037]
MTYFIPVIINLIAAGIALHFLSSRIVTQVFILFVVSYTVVFPAIEFILSPYPFYGSFSRHQLVIGTLFLVPLFAFIAQGCRIGSEWGARPVSGIILSHLLPVIFIAGGVLFVIETVVYGLFFARLGYENFLQTYEGTPTLLLLHYRISVETSFFVILFLLSCIRFAPKDRNIVFYKVALLFYCIVFGSYFLVNSRMQFLLLVILLVASGYRGGGINFGRLLKVGSAVVFLAFTLTFLREFVIEKNYRLDASSATALLTDTTLLIAARLNSVVMIDTAALWGYNIWVPNFEGLWFFVKLNTAPIFDPNYYELMKSIEITSPSVYVINTILAANYVDFPKSMMVEVLLLFGALGLPALAFILAKVIVFVQRELRSGDPSDIPFVLALYILPLVMQFEKEFTGFLTSIFKWSPVFILVIILRPRRSVSREGGESI